MIRHTSRSLIAVVLVLLSLLLILPHDAILHSQDAATQEPTQAVTDYTGAFEGTVLFGTPLALTGSLSKEGKLSQEGYELWKEVYNKAGGIVIDGKHYLIDIKFYDDESDAKKSATLAEKLVTEDKVNFLLGPYGTSATLQVSAVAEKNGIPMVEGNGVAESIFAPKPKFTFLVASPAQNYLRGVIEMALAQNPAPKTVAILSADDAFSKEVAESARKFAEEQGLTVVYFQNYPDKSTEFEALLTDAKAKNPDLLLNSGHYAESVAMVQQAKALDFLAKGYGFSVGPSLPNFQTTLKTDANYIVGGAQWTADLKYDGDDLFKTPQNYQQVYMERWEHAPSYQSASSTVSGITFVKAIETAGSLEAQKVRDALVKLDLMTFYGQVKFDERGVNIYKPMVVEQWQDGYKGTIWPADAASAEPQWPAPAWDKR